MATTSTHWARIASPSLPAYSVFTLPITKSPQDNREYRIIRLDNGLEATLIHDVEADKAAASLDVAVGHLYDPDDMPGLAHFCEHLLFMGTEKFPIENEYSEYLAKNNGSSNAYTSTSNTNYYFNVSTNALPGALERFAAFFHCPLFTPSCTSRELNAVDSEHKKNHQSDMWRIFQLNKHLSQPNHVWSKFGSGSRESLSKAAQETTIKPKLPTATVISDGTTTSPLPSRRASPASSVSSNSNEVEADGGTIGREVRRRLIEWWSEEYCSSRMRLCIIGKESLEELSSLAARLFSPIPNRGKDPLPMIEEHPFGAEEKGTLISVQTVMAFHALEISFPLEYQAPYWKYKPSNLLAHFTGHEGPGSLFSFLKDKGWVTSLNSGPQNLARGFAMFKITIYMTEDGFKHYKDILNISFQYLSLLRTSGIAPFHQREVASLSSIRFRFSEKRRPDDYATWITEHMSWPLPREQLLAGPQIVSEWDGSEGARIAQAKLSEYLNAFRLDQCRVVLMATAAEHAKLNSNRIWKQEPWYGTKYYVERFDTDFEAQANGSNTFPDLYLPGPNKFIPTDLEVVRHVVTEPAKRPHLIRETPLSTLWYKKDDRFWVPKGHVVVDLRSPASNVSARASVLTRVFTELVTDSLTEFSYDADLAGLSYNLVPHTTGFLVAMHGYNDRMLVLAEEIQKRIKTMKIKPERLAVIKESVQRDWKNFFLGQSYSLSDFYGRYALADKQWTVEEKLKELPSVMSEEIEHYIKSVLEQANLRILVTGNVKKDVAIRLAEIAESGLGISRLAPTELNDRALLLPKGCNYIWSAPVPNPNQTNSALTYYIHFGTIDDQRLRVTASLLAQILSEPAFNVLRTREQLGYIVHCSSWSLPGASERGLRIVVQSEKNARYLESRVDAFLKSTKSVLEVMELSVFSQHKSGLQKKWLEADKNLSDEAGRFMAHISSGQWDFLRNENDAKTLDTITKDDVISLFSSHVDPNSLKRSKLSVHLESQKPKTQHLSSDAIQVVTTFVRASSPDFANLQEPQFPEQSPTVTDFLAYWELQIAHHHSPKGLLEEISKIAERYYAPSEETPLPMGTTLVKDLQEFKGHLQKAPVLGPLVSWGDLPMSKF